MGPLASQTVFRHEEGEREWTSNGTEYVFLLS